MYMKTIIISKSTKFDTPPPPKKNQVYEYIYDYFKK